MDTAFLISLIHRIILSGEAFNDATYSVLCEYARNHFNWNRSETKNFIDEQIREFKKINIDTSRQIYEKLLLQNDENEIINEYGTNQTPLDIQHIQQRSKEILRKYHDKYILLSTSIKEKINIYWEDELNNQKDHTQIKKIYTKIFQFNYGESIETYLIKVVDYTNVNNEFFLKFVGLKHFTIVSNFVKNLKNVIDSGEIKHIAKSISTYSASNKYRFYEYTRYENIINRNKNLIDLKWHLEFSKLRPLITTRFSEIKKLNIKSYLQCLLYIKKIGPELKIKSLRSDHKKELLLAIESVFQYIIDLKEENYDYELFCLTICKIDSEEWNWYLAYKQNNGKEPIFWIFKKWINYENSKIGKNDFEKFLLLNCIQLGGLKSNDISNFTSYSDERIRQLFETIPSNLIQLIKTFRSIIRSYSSSILTDLPDYSFVGSTKRIDDINSLNSVNFTRNLYIIFYSTIFPSKYMRVGDDKYIYYEHVDTRKRENFISNALYLTTLDENYHVLLSCLDELKNICSNRYNESEIKVSNFTNLTQWNKNIIISEGLIWRSKIKKKGRQSTSYVNTKFSISEDGKLTWQDGALSDLDISRKAFSIIFFNSAQPQVLTLNELRHIHKKSFTKEDGTVIDVQLSLMHLKKELGLLSVANKWMSKDYAERHFDKSIYSKTKCSFKDAIYYMIIKDKNTYNNLPLKKWVTILNRVLNQKYSINNLWAISKDARFNFIEKRNGRKSLNEIHLSDYHFINK